MKRILEEAFSEAKVKATAEQFDLFVGFWNEVERANRVINLTAITDPKDAAWKHFVDVVMGASFLEWPVSSKVIDVGSGAGFPGIVLKIWRPDLKLTLVDSIGKKVNFVRETVARLGLIEIEALKGRAEELGQAPLHREAYDLAISRAVAPLRVLNEYLLPLVRVGGKTVAWKGIGVAEEKLDATPGLKILGGEMISFNNYKIGQYGSRVLVSIKKTRPTPAGFPRMPGQPQKKPL